MIFCSRGNITAPNVMDLGSSPPLMSWAEDVQRFRGGLVFKAHRLCASLNSRLASNKEEDKNNFKPGLEVQELVHNPLGGVPGFRWFGFSTIT